MYIYLTGILDDKLDESIIQWIYDNMSSLFSIDCLEFINIISDCFVAYSNQINQLKLVNRKSTDLSIPISNE